jgi:YD repeat-containing protein
MLPRATAYACVLVGLLSTLSATGRAATLLSSNFNTGAQGWVVGTGPHQWKLNNLTDGSGNYYGMNNTWCVSNTHQYDNNFAGSPAIALVGGQKYVLSFQVKLQALTTHRDLGVYLNTTPAQNGSEVRIFWKHYGDGEGTTWVNQTAEFIAPATGNHHILIDAFLAGYRAIYVDDVVVEDAIPPQVSLTSPAANSAVLEFTTVNLTCSATDADGTVTKVEYFANGNLVATATTAPFSATWSGMAPGQYQIQAKAWDNRNLATLSANSAFTVNFTDGTLNEYRHWKFDADSTGWTLSGGWKMGGTLSSTAVDSADFAASPALYLFAGVNYKVEFYDDADGSGRQVTLAYNTSPSIFGGKTDIATYTFASTDDFNLKWTATFSVPQSGRYYLALFVTSQSSGPLGSSIDNLRIIGDMNSAPQVTLPSDIHTNTAVNAYANLVATATDADGSVASVDFIAGNSVFATDTATPYEALWRPSTAGNVTVSATARDNNDGLGYSNELLFNVKPNAFSASSLIGGSGSADSARGVAIQSDGTLVVGANIGDAMPGGLAPILLNGANSTTSGAVLRLSPDGRSVLSVTRVAGQVVDLDLDAAGNIYVAAMGQGVLKLNPAASSLTWARIPANYTQRIDVASSGAVAALTSSATDPDSQTKSNGATVIYDATGVQIGATSGASANTHDICLDEASQTVIVVGHRNYNTWDGSQVFPVDVPGIKGYSYNGTLKYLGYDWEADTASPRYLNKYDNNKADTRAVRCSIGEDGKLYVAFTTAGGNHPLRYSPFDLTQRVTIVGGDFYNTLAFTNTEIHLFVGRYEPATLTYLLGQDLTGRLPDGAGNTITARTGEICGDAMGRVYVTGSAAYGFPLSIDHFPGGYTGGAFLLVMSPDFSTREIGLRLTESGNGHGLAVRGNTVAFVGTSDRKSTGEVSFYGTNPV